MLWSKNAQQGGGIKLSSRAEGSTASYFGSHMLRTCKESVTGHRFIPGTPATLPCPHSLPLLLSTIASLAAISEVKFG